MKNSLLLAAMLCGTPLLVPNPKAQAQATVTGGIKLPPGNEPYTQNADPFARILNSVAKDQDVRRKPTGDAAQVWIWQGTNYDAEGAPMLRMRVKQALIQAGFGVSTSDNVRMRINLSDFFDANDTDAPFYPNPWTSPEYISANNPETGKAFVCALIESDKSLVVAMLPVVGEKKASAAKSNPLRNARYVTDGNDAFKDLVGTNPTFYSIARKAGMVRGEIKHVGGMSIAGATVSVQAGAFGGLTTQHTGRSNAEGVYEVAVPTGLCRVSSAWCHIKYNGLTYALPLQSADGVLEQFDNKRGHTENFVLRIHGKASPTASPSDFKSYYGGSIRISRPSSIPKGGKLELTLIPQGALINGNLGLPIVYRAANDDNDMVLNNIPLGRYKATVKLINADGAMPLQVEKFPTNKIGDAVIVDFEPVTSNQPDFGYCPVRQFHISLHD